MTDKANERCEKHGVAYSPIMANGREIGLHCPECALEHVQSLGKSSSREGAALLRSSEIASRRKQLSERLDRVGIPPRYRRKTFDSFVALDKQQAGAVARSRRYADGLCSGSVMGGLLLVGTSGTGKTHLACSIANQFQKTGADVVVTTVADMVSKIRESYNPNSRVTELEAIKSYRDIDLLVLDEVGVQKGDPAEVNLITRVINDRYGWEKPTILISNYAVSAMEGFLGSRVIDRMREDGGAVIEFKWDSFRSRAAEVHRA